MYLLHQPLFSQSPVALSSGESEYYAIVRAAAQGLHVAAICDDLGLINSLGPDRRKEFHDSGGSQRQLGCPHVWAESRPGQTKARTHAAAVDPRAGGARQNKYPTSRNQGERSRPADETVCSRIG
eukprot:6440191-Amphidinium_carterae.2